MSNHPIQGLMSTAMENIKSMIDVNTIVGDPVHTPSGETIIPISKVGFGFVAGGSEMRMDEENTHAHHDHTDHLRHHEQVSLPFGGGSGGGVSITPIAFLVVGASGIKVIPLDSQTHIIDRVIDSAPAVFDKLQAMWSANQMNSTANATNQYNDSI